MPERGSAGAPGSRAPLSVAIDVGRVTPGESGGLAHVIVGLVHALGQLADGAERFVVVVGSEEQENWLGRFIGPNQKLVMRPDRGADGKDTLVQRTARRLSPAVRYFSRRSRGASPRWPEVPISDGFHESLGCDVVHFPHQDFVVCALPAVYNPHDLQHRHYPQFFTPLQIARRETLYEAGHRLSRVVVVASQWIKDDVIRQYGVSGDKVQVVPWGAPTLAYPPPAPADLARVSRKYGLARPFALYPARTWPHKNHLRLLQAMAHLRDARGKSVTVVFTGAPYEPFWPRIEQAVRDLRLAGQVKFLGFVPDEDLRPLYRLSEFLLMPTLFESDSFPVFEAWLDALPVACSSVTALPDQVGDAALLFDPTDEVAMADAIERLVSSDELREHLRRRGDRRVRDFDWARTAKAYRAVYRRASGRQLDDEDRWLLGWDWMREPERAG